MTSSPLPSLYLARHGDTAWTDFHRHTGRTDLPLNEHGMEHARQLGEWLRPLSFVRVFSSPLQRASKTCELAGFGAAAELDADLVEWDYGRLEGMLTSDILKQHPAWELFRDGCPGGESPKQIAARADRFVARVKEMAGDVLAFSSGHIMRMIAARWLGLPPVAGRFFYCRPASVGVLAFEHKCLDEPVVSLWNYVAQPFDAASNSTLDQHGHGMSGDFRVAGCAAGSGDERERVESLPWTTPPGRAPRPATGA